MGHLALRRCAELLAILVFLQISACTRYYRPLALIDKESVWDARKWRELRTDIKNSLVPVCYQHHSAEDKKTFYDFYKCGDNLYVSHSDLGMAISYENGKNLPNPDIWKSIAKKVFSKVKVKFTSAEITYPSQTDQ